MISFQSLSISFFTYVIFNIISSKLFNTKDTFAFWKINQRKAVFFPEAFSFWLLIFKKFSFSKVKANFFLQISQKSTPFSKLFSEFYTFWMNLLLCTFYIKKKIHWLKNLLSGKKGFSCVRICGFMLIS